MPTPLQLVLQLMLILTLLQLLQLVLVLTLLQLAAQRLRILSNRRSSTHRSSTRRSSMQPLVLSPKMQPRVLSPNRATPPLAPPGVVLAEEACHAPDDPARVHVIKCMLVKAMMTTTTVHVYSHARTYTYI